MHKSKNVVISSALGMHSTESRKALDKPWSTHGHGHDRDSSDNPSGQIISALVHAKVANARQPNLRDPSSRLQVTVMDQLISNTPMLALFYASMINKCELLVASDHAKPMLSGFISAAILGLHEISQS
ncbi:hypothetical protein VTK56DRAFT_7367 [Thermocarpiscus australiensis]